LGTFWEHDENTLGTWEQHPKSLSLPLKKKENWTIHECMLSHHFLPGIGLGIKSHFWFRICTWEVVWPKGDKLPWRKNSLFKRANHLPPRHFKESCRSMLHYWKKIRGAKESILSTWMLKIVTQWTIILRKETLFSKRKHSKYMNVENNNTMHNNTQKRNTLFQKK